MMAAELRVFRAEIKAAIARLELHLTFRLGLMIIIATALAIAAVRYL